MVSSKECEFQEQRLCNFFITSVQDTMIGIKSLQDGSSGWIENLTLSFLATNSNTKEWEQSPGWERSRSPSLPCSSFSKIIACLGIWHICHWFSKHLPGLQPWSGGTNMCYIAVKKGNERITYFLPWFASLFLSIFLLCFPAHNKDLKNT